MNRRNFLAGAAGLSALPAAPLLARPASRPAIIPAPKAPRMFVSLVRVDRLPEHINLDIATRSDLPENCIIVEKDIGEKTEGAISFGHMAETYGLVNLFFWTERMDNFKQPVILNYPYMEQGQSLDVVFGDGWSPQ